MFEILLINKLCSNNKKYEYNTTKGEEGRSSPSSRLIDLSNKTFGKYTIVGRDNSVDNDGAYWLCNCSVCGETKLIKSSRLVTGKIKTCSCQPFNYNIFEEKDNCYYVYIDINNQNNYFIIDKDKFPIINSYCWYWNTKGVPQTTSYNNESGVTIYSLLFPNF
jgi:hypothetical protein